MAPYFYLSCSAEDNSELLKEFFENLSTAVRFWLQLPREEEVGFFDPTASTSGQGWGPEKDEALRTSQAMIAMVSPNYFKSADAGKERQVFEIRDWSIYKSGHIPSPIIPVTWIPCPDASAKVFGPESLDWTESFKIYRLNGLMNLMELRGSLPSFGDEYWAVLLALAKQIKRFKVAIVDNNKLLGRMLRRRLSALGYECRFWRDAKPALKGILKDKTGADGFDVVLVDLELEVHKMQGLALIEKLAADDDSPPVIAMAPGLSNSESVEALKTGAIDVIPKPFDLRQVEWRIRNVARIGYTRRQFRENRRPVVHRERPVFLSYSNIDRRTAKILKTQLEVRGIGVWYAPHTLGPDDPPMQTISNGLKDAKVFVALVTDNFARSAWCLWELTSYQGDPNKILVIPVLDGCVQRMRNSELIKEITKRFVCDITFDRFPDGLTLLLGKIQLAVNS
jgi:DNA-binding response OmpR family regulator